MNSIDQHEPLNRNLFSNPSKYPKRINLDHQQSLLMSPIDRKISEQSDGSESGVGSESNPYSDQENRLVSQMMMMIFFENKIGCLYVGNDL